jgi:hypothetical protein
MKPKTKKAAVTEEAESHFDIQPPLSKSEVTVSAWRRLRDMDDEKRDRLLEKHVQTDLPLLPMPPPRPSWESETRPLHSHVRLITHNIDAEAGSGSPFLSYGKVILLTARPSPVPAPPARSASAPA